MNEKRGFCVDRGSSSFKYSKKVKYSKKGQITVFIIVGILILFAFAVFLFLTKEVRTEEFTAEGEPVVAAVPQTFQPIAAYTENCLTQVGERGLIILGQQGGYIYPDVLGEFSSADPSNADGIYLEPLKVPYWHYNYIPNEENLIEYSSLEPKLYAKEDSEMSIETQLARYAEENLNTCIGDYISFKQAGFEIDVPALAESGAESKEITISKEVTVNVAENTVNFWLKMPVTAKKGGAEAKMNQFFVKIPLRLKHYYEVADEIAKVQQNYSFLELQALDLITAFSAADNDKLPPMEELRFEYFPTVSWNEMDVKERIKGMLTSYIPLLRYLGSTNFYRYEYSSRQIPSRTGTVDLSTLFQKNYDNMIIPLEKAKNVEINFDYFGWEPYFDMNDKGGKIMPTVIHTTTSLFNLPFSLNHYYSVYDVSYPVLVSIRDPNALLGKGYNFVFALESNIRNNLAAKAEFKQPEPIRRAFDSMVCDENKMNTGMIKTIVVDSATFEPLEAVRIGLTIPEQDDCIMGLTDSDGVFESKYPAIYGGVMSFIKDEYLMNFYPVDTYRYKKNPAASSAAESPAVIGYAFEGLPERVIPMHKKKMINVTFKKKNLEKCIEDDDGSTICFGMGLFAAGEEVSSYDIESLEERHFWVFPNAAASLSDAETATLIMNRVKDVNSGMANENFVASVSVEGTGSGKVELVPGVYSVSVLLTNAQSLTIPAEDRGDYELPQQVLDEMLTGQLQWDTPAAYLTITPEDLYNSDEITFSILSFNLAAVPELEHVRVIEDTKMMGELSNLSRQLREYLDPKFS